MIDAILEIKGMVKDDSNQDKNEGFETNGWEWDWWQDFNHEGRAYTLSGSGYYGGHEFELNEDQP